MVCTGDTSASLEIWKDESWTPCVEFECLESIREVQNSATRVTIGVESHPSPFSIVITLSKTFEWPARANGLRVKLTFDQGDIVNDYCVVALRQEAVELDEDPNFYILDENVDGSLSCRIKAISLPLNVKQAHETWYRAFLEFKRVERVKENSKRLTSSGLSTGTSPRVKIDVVACIVERNPRKNSRIPIDVKSPYVRSRHSADSRTTLKATLRYDLLQPSSDLCRYLSTPIAGSPTLSFTFLYGDPGSCVKIEAEDIDIIGNVAVDAQKAGKREKRSQLSSTPISESSTLINEQSVPAPLPVSNLQSIEHPLVIAQRKQRSVNPPHSDLNKRADKAIANIGDLVPLLEKAAKMRRESREFRYGDLKSEADAENLVIQEQLQDNARQMKRARSMLQEAQDLIRNLEEEKARLLTQEESVQGRLREIEDEVEYKSDDEGTALFETARKAVEDLHHHQQKKVSSHKRRRSQVSTEQSSPSRFREEIHRSAGQGGDSSAQRY